MIHNLFDDQQTEQNKKGVSIGCISTMCAILSSLDFPVHQQIATMEMGQWDWQNIGNPTVQSHYKPV